MVGRGRDRFQKTNNNITHGQYHENKQWKLPNFLNKHKNGEARTLSIDSLIRNWELRVGGGAGDCRAWMRQMAMNKFTPDCWQRSGRFFPLVFFYYFLLLCLFALTLSFAFKLMETAAKGAMISVCLNKHINRWGRTMVVERPAARTPSNN